MTRQTYSQLPEPHSNLISALSDIISPLVFSLTNGVVFLLSGLTRRRQKESSPQPLSRPHSAPHVAMVMVPGNFMTGPFIKR